MSLIRFGKACDGLGCTVRFNDYSVGDILGCEDCGLDLCAKCRAATSHRSIREEICCQDCPAPAAKCDPQEQEAVI